jgi:CheY-like chemotaxis protein
MDTKPFRRIIVVDDEKASLVLARLVLDQLVLADRLLAFQTVDEAIAYLRESCSDAAAATSDCPDLVLLDVNMPGKDGIDFLADLAALREEKWVEVKVVLLTSSNHRTDLCRAAAYQVKAYVVKPITEDKVTRLVESKSQWW